MAVHPKKQPADKLPPLQQSNHGRRGDRPYQRKEGDAFPAPHRKINAYSPCSNNLASSERRSAAAWLPMPLAS